MSSDRSRPVKEQYGPRCPDRPTWDAEIIVAKAPERPTGSAHLLFLNQFARFDNMRRVLKQRTVTRVTWSPRRP